MITRCPLCGGEVHIVTKDILVQAGHHAALLRGERVGECERCGEEFYTPETIQRMEDLKKRLSANNLSGLKPVGQFFIVETVG